MITKPKDVLYCGVDKAKIATAKPKLNDRNLKLLMHFISERQGIYIERSRGYAAPWTDDPILREYKFTNVRRENDRQTKYLIENVCLNPALNLRDKIYNVFLLRAWNNWDTMRDFGGPWPYELIKTPELKEHVRPIYHKLLAKDPDRRWWSAAYNQGGTKYAWKFPDGEGMARAKSEEAGRKFADYEPDIPLRTFHIGPWLDELCIAKRLVRVAKNQQEAFEIIKEVRGFSTFLAYQIFVDLTYIPEFPFSENEFTVAGPGCRKGIDYVFEDRDGMTYEEAIFWMRNYLNEVNNGKWIACEVFNDMPPQDQFMNVMSMENCFCEISKYIRAIDGTGRPKMKFKPTVE